MAAEKTSYIRDVWHDNLEVEMANIREMIVNYPVVSMVRRSPPRPKGLCASCSPPPVVADALVRWASVHPHRILSFLGWSPSR